MFTRLFFVSILSVPFCVAAERRFEFSSVQMGVPVRVVLYLDGTDNAPDDKQCEKSAKSAADEAFQIFQTLNGIMSDYDSDSELSQLSAKEGSVRISDDLFAVLKASKHYSTISGGAFDVTVGNLTKLWRRSRRQHSLPKAVHLEKAKELTGNALWQLDEKTQSVVLKKSGMRFDLGGIAKGYAIDKAFEAVQKRGIASVLIDAGGDLRLGKAPKNGWNIKLEDGQFLADLQNVALATSGGTVQFVEIDGKKYSHIIDPKTGLGLTTPCLVSVFAPTATEADAFASAVSVLGADKGLALVESQKNIAVKIVLYEEKKSVQSKDWKK
jgi:thiamine biosynthesis lipoprotein